MAKWQPPIPSGALWSREVIDTNAGPLLAYCYDCIQTDGTFTIQLSETAGDMGIEYRTIKRWWSALQNGPFFASVKDCGRKGFLVRMADDWLDWRILKARQSVQPEGPKMAPEEVKTTPNDAQDHFKAVSSSFEGTKMELNGNAYKVLHTTSETIDSAVTSADVPAAQPAKKKRPAKQEPQSPIEVRRTIAKGSQIDLDSGLQKDIIQVNQAAATIWNKLRTPDQSLESALADIRACGKWVRTSQHPYKGSDQCMPPSALVRFWPAWKEAATKAKPYLNGHTNGVHAPAEPALSLEEQRRRSAEAASKYPPLVPGGGGR